MENLGSPIDKGSGRQERGGESRTIQFLVEREPCNVFKGHEYPYVVWVFLPILTYDPRPTGIQCGGAVYKVVPGTGKTPKSVVCEHRGHLIE